jgi:hypothetical protein
MRRISAYAILSLLLLGIQASTRAQDILVPAGTLLHCTLDEPNFSSATADIGDPVVCHLNSLRQFGQEVFPRGSYLGGHLEADKDPGHFVGKGFLKLEFDRIGFPSSDIPVPSKVIAAKGYKVDRHGEIVGKGHATRDVVEWLIPPLWPWKILTLPARGPRPTLKGEEQITLRLMDDIVVPRATSSANFNNRPTSYDRPPATYRRQSFERQQQSNKPPSSSQVQVTANAAANNDSAAENVSQSAPADENVSVSTVASPSLLDPVSTEQLPAVRTKLIALKSDAIYEVTRYRIDNGSLNYVLSSGETGSIDIGEVDWRKTSRLNAGPAAMVTSTAALN